MKQYRSGVAPGTNTPKKRRRTKHVPYSIEADFKRLVDDFNFLGLKFTRELFHGWFRYHLVREGEARLIHDLGEARQILNRRWDEWGGKL